MGRRLTSILVVAIVTWASAQDQIDRDVTAIRASQGKSRYAAMRTLTDRGKEAIPALIKLSNDKDRGIASLATTNLVYFRDPRVLPVLREKLSLGNQLDRSTLLLAIGNHGNPKGLAVVTPYLHDTDRLVRGSAAYALGRLADPKAIPSLETLRSDPVQSVRWQASKSIRWIKSTASKFPDRLKNRDAWWDG